MKLLITGVNGFVGGHLTAQAKADGHMVIGCGLEEKPNQRVAKVLDDYVRADLTKADDAGRLPLADVEGVIHLAGLAAVGPSFDKPHAYMEVNEGAVIELFEAAQRSNAKPRFLIISSGAVYASEHEERDESTPTEVSSPYNASKLGAETWTDYYRGRGFDAIIARPFNHAGPGQEKGFIIPDIASQIVEAGDGEQSSIKVGNIATERDYTDVRDVVRAYLAIITATKLNHSLYNICSGVSVSGKHILDELRRLSGHTDMKYEAAVSELRPNDVAKVTGTYQRLHEDTGWQPQIPLETTLQDALNDWRSKLS